MKGRYVRPENLGEALEALENPAARLLAGGTDLLVDARREGILPDLLVDITRVPELQSLTDEEDGSLRVGAAVSHARVAASPLVRRLAPLLAGACAAVGSVQIRNLGTVGGNVANAAVAADTLPALAALRAHYEVAGPGGTCRLDGDEFFQGPGRTAVGPGELLTAVLIPLQPPHGACFLKVGRRQAAAISRLSAAVAVNPTTGMARVSVGAVFPTPRRVEAAEEELGRGFDEGILEAAARAAQDYVRAVSGERPSMRYKLPAVRGLVSKALRRAVADLEATR